MSSENSVQPTAAMLVIGDEILSGRTREGNGWHLAKELTEAGVTLREMRVVADDKADIVDAVRTLSDKYDYVFTSGGIGPTHDDITADCVAEAFGDNIDVRDDAHAILIDHYGTDEINEARLRMARIPDTATLIANPVSRAPGFKIRNVHVMAGVPKVFEAMVAEVLPTLRVGDPLLSWALRVEAPEGEMAGPLGEVDARHPNVSFGSYPFFRGVLGSSLIGRSADLAALTAGIDDLRATLIAKGLDKIEETPPT